MARARKDKAEDDAVPEQETFEELLGKLEALVARLERGEQPLEVALEDFESGMALSRRANEVLEKAELRLAVLTAGGQEEPLSLPADRA